MSILDAIMSRIISKSSSIYKILELFERIISKCSNSIIPYHNKVDLLKFLIFNIYMYTIVVNKLIIIYNFRFWNVLIIYLLYLVLWQKCSLKQLFQLLIII